MAHQPLKEIGKGGVAQYCVEHRGVTWTALIAVLLWGAISYTKLGQQEDPSIPQRVGRFSLPARPGDGLPGLRQGVCG